jgi:ankyrin repeat protein
MSRSERLLFAGLVFLSAIVVSRGSHAMSGPVPHYLAVSHSIAHDRDLDLHNQYAAGSGYRFQAAATTNGGSAVVGRDGGLYATDALGFSLMMAPVLVAVDAVVGVIPDRLLAAVRWNPERAARDLISFVMALVTAWTAVLTVRLCSAVLPESSIGPLVAILFLAPPLLGASILAIPEIPAAFLVVAFALERLRPAPRAWLMALALAALPWLHLRYVVFSTFGALWAMRAPAEGTNDSSRVVSIGAVPALSIAALLVHRFWQFGTVAPTLPADAGWLTIASVLSGVPGLLLDVDFGLFWVAPFCLLGFAGIANVRRSQPGYGRFAGRSLLGVASIAAALGTWRAYGSPAGEWVPLLPLVAPFWVAGFRALARMPWRWLGYAGIGWALALSLALAARPARLWTRAGESLGRVPGAAIGSVFSPEARLGRLGLALDESTFHERVRAGDLHAVDLYLDAGFAPGPALVAAVRGRQQPALARLLGEPLQPDHDVARALLWAEQEPDAAMATALRAAGARHDLTSARGETALIAAVVNDRPDELDMLIAAGVDLNARTRAGHTALYLAVFDGRAEATRRLIAAGADVNRADADGWTPLMAALRRPQPDVARALIAAGADVDVMTRLGWTALMWAAYDGQVGIAGDLVAAGADVNLTSKAGQSALIRAAGQGHLAIVQLLLEHGANAAAVIDGATAHGWASRNGHVAAAALLASAGRGEP